MTAGAIVPDEGRTGTDPMSHENCLTVFVGRALAAVKEGGDVRSALKIARDEWRRTDRRVVLTRERADEIRARMGPQSTPHIQHDRYVPWFDESPVQVIKLKRSQPSRAAKATAEK